jgi:2-iminobutanoate/2-iminopropanoate deaminase
MSNEKPHAMNEKQIIRTKNAPAAIGPYSQAVFLNGTLYCSGQIAIDPASGQMIEGDVAAETKRVMENLKAVLAEADMDFSHVLKVSIFLKDLNDYSTVNAVYASYFSQNPPAREAVQVVRLPKDAAVEISLIAAK